MFIAALSSFSGGLAPDQPSASRRVGDGRVQPQRPAARPGGVELGVTQRLAQMAAGALHLDAVG